LYDIYMYLAKTSEGSKTVVTDIGGLEWDHVTPPPAAADVALEQLRQARHKRQDSFHIFVCPKL